MGGVGVVEVENPETVIFEWEPTGILHVLDQTGDSRIQWNKNNPDQVLAAKARWDEFKAKGYLAYKVDTTSGQRTNEVIHAFDPTAERIIMMRQTQGG